MFAIITTEEYKELIEAKQDADMYRNAYQKNKTELQEIKTEINSLLLMLTDNEREASCGNKEFQLFEIANCDAIASYINENFVEDGKLKLKEIEE